MLLWFILVLMQCPLQLGNFIIFGAELVQEEIVHSDEVFFQDTAVTFFMYLVFLREW
jgi:hypothetical protein